MQRLEFSNITFAAFEDSKLPRRTTDAKMKVELHSFCLKEEIDDVVVLVTDHEIGPVSCLHL